MKRLIGISVLFVCILGSGIFVGIKTTEAIFLSKKKEIIKEAAVVMFTAPLKLSYNIVKTPIVFLKNSVEGVACFSLGIINGLIK